MPGRLVLVRHGQSTWNLENLFTGWTDVDLTAQGSDEARAAGGLLRDQGLEFDVAFTSVLKRAIRTLWIMLDEMDRMWIPVERRAGGSMSATTARCRASTRRRPPRSTAKPR